LSQILRVGSRQTCPSKPTRQSNVLQRAVNRALNCLVRVHPPDLYLPNITRKIVSGHADSAPCDITVHYPNKHPWLKPCESCGPIPRPGPQVDIHCAPRRRKSHSPCGQKRRMDPALGTIAAPDAAPVAKLGNDLNWQALELVDPPNRILLARSDANIRLRSLQRHEARNCRVADASRLRMSTRSNCSPQAAE